MQQDGQNRFNKKNKGPKGFRGFFKNPGAWLADVRTRSEEEKSRIAFLGAVTATAFIGIGWFAALMLTGTFTSVYSINKSAPKEVVDDTLSAWEEIQQQFGELQTDPFADEYSNTAQILPTSPLQQESGSEFPVNLNEALNSTGDGGSYESEIGRELYSTVEASLGAAGAIPTNTATGSTSTITGGNLFDDGAVTVPIGSLNPVGIDVNDPLSSQFPSSI